MIYQPFGPMSDMLYGNNLLQSKSYDLDCRLTQLITTNSYDIRGRKVSMNDPDMGVWAYQYNVLGELISLVKAGKFSLYPAIAASAPYSQKRRPRKNPNE